MLDVIKSYLVGLGFQVNQSEFQQAQNAINDLGRTIQNATAGMTKNFAVAATGVVAALATINAATAGLIAQVAKADMEYQKFALRMWTTKDTAKELQSTLKAMGEDMESVAFIPELRQQYFELLQQGRKMQTPIDADEQLKFVRSIMFEFKRLKLEVQYASEWISYYLIKYLSGPLATVRKQLREFNDKLVATMPEWTKKIAQLLATFMNFGIAVGRFFKDLYNGFMRFFDMLPSGAKKAVMAITAIGAAFTISPIGATVATLILLLEDFYGYVDGRKSSKTLAPVWSSLISALDMIDQSIKDIEPTIKEFWNTATQWADSASNALQRYWNTFKESEFAKSLLKVFVSLWELLKTIIIGLAEGLEELFEGFADLFGFLLDDGTLEMVVDLFTTLFQTISSLILGMANLTKESGKFWKAVAGTNAARTMWDWFKGTISFVLKLVSSLGKSFLGLFDMIGLGLQGKFGEAAERGRRIFKDLQRDFDSTMTGKAEAAGQVSGSYTERLRKAIASKESSNNPTAANYDGMAFGKYQFQQGTWDSVARMSGRRDLVGINPMNVGEADQDEVAQFYVNYLWSKYHDAEKVAAVWYAGEDYVDKWVAGKAPYSPYKQMNREGYAVDSGGVYPSVSDYGKDVADRMGNSNTTALNVSTSGIDSASPFVSAIYTARDNMAGYQQNSQSSYAPSPNNYASNSTVTVGDININQPNATPTDISTAVTNGIQQAQRRSIAVQTRDLKAVIV